MSLSNKKKKEETQVLCLSLVSGESYEFGISAMKCSPEVGCYNDTT
jgi:hypothetical protein